MGAVRQAVMVVMAMTMLLTSAASQGPMGTMGIQNDFYNKLFFQCSTEQGQRPVTIVPPKQTYKFLFYPDETAFWVCSVYATVPRVWGSFTLYDGRTCYPSCLWKATEDGMHLVSGGPSAIFYPWQRRS